MIVRVIGYSGSRRGMTERQRAEVSRILFRLKPNMVVHGACIGGDAEFDQICEFKKIARRWYPANNVPDHLVMIQQDLLNESSLEVRRPSPAPYRNNNIIQDSDVMICCPAESHEPDNPRGSGTWFSVRHTRLAHKPLLLIPPNGLVIEERVEEVLYTPKRRRYLK